MSLILQLKGKIVIDIGLEIKTGRVKKGLNQEELAKIIGATKTSVSRWENGTRVPPSDILIKIGEVLEIGHIFAGYPVKQSFSIEIQKKTSISSLKEKRKKAKKLIVEIIKQNGRVFAGKTKLYKTFYFAHLFFVMNYEKNLSQWFIVKMNHGPGIDQGDQLLLELEEKEFLTKKKDFSNVPYVKHVYTLSEKTFKFDLDKKEIDSIKEAVDFVKGKTGAELSQITHEHSIAWNSANMGDEIDIFTDADITK